jgi:pimeloyl-ACP methyl ester carboxylesterase
VIVGFSLGGEVAGALTASSPQLVSGLVLIDTAPDKSYWNTPLKQKISRVPVVGQALWRITPDSQIKQGYEIAFAKGYPVPDFAVDDLRRMTYSSYKDSFRSAKSFISEEPLDTRLSPTAVPLLVIFGAEDRSEDPSAAQHYDSVPGAQIQLVQGSGHSPMIEKPAETARLIEDFAEPLFAGLRRQQAKAAAKRRQAARAKRQAARQKQRKAHQAKRKQRSKSG